MDTPDPATVLEAPVSQHAILLGAPGSGKTEILVRRFEALLAQGQSPDSLIIVTPTRIQASSLRDTVGVRLGLTTQGARVRSLAALAFSCVQDYHRDKGLPPPDLMKASQIDVDIQALLEGHLEDQSGPSWPEPLGPDVRSTRVFRGELREWMARAGESGASNDQIRAAAATARRPDWVAAVEFREEFQSVMASARPGAFDSGEIFARAREALSEQLPQQWRSLRHVMVDDAHDLTHAGLDLLVAISRLGVGITVASEPDVAGNTFRGSEPGGHAYLGAAWGLAPAVLPEVFRHGVGIRRVVTEITSRIGAAQAGTQRAAAGADRAGVVNTLLAPSSQAEAFNIARIIRESQLDENTPPQRIAVIARRGSRVTQLVRDLTLAGIPARQSLTGSTLRDQPAAKELVELLALALGILPLTSRQAVLALSGLYGAMTQRELRRLRFALRKSAPADEPYQPVDVMLAQALGHRGGFALYDTQIASKAHTLATALAEVRDIPDASVAELLWLLWEGTGAHRSWARMAHQPSTRQAGVHRALDAVVALFSQAADFGETSPGASARVFIDSVLNAEVPNDVVLPAPLWPAVVVSTPSGVVGQEFDLVVVSGVEDGVWPDLRLRGSLLASHRLGAALRGVDDAVIDEAKVVKDDELRLFALATSRTCQRLVVTATQSEESEPSALFSLVTAHAEALAPEKEPAASPRSVVGRLRRELYIAVEGGKPTSDIAQDLALAAHWNIPGAHPDTWWGLAPISTTEPLYPHGEIPVSPSALGAIEESPMDWFLSSVARNDPAPARGVGLLLHQAWEAHPDGDPRAMWNDVESRFGELEYEAGWVESYQRRIALAMVSALGDYTRDRRSEGASVVATEAFFSIHHGNVVMRGVIDRLEATVSGDILVVDLKTGAHQTDAGVADNPQMLAYQMGLESEEMRQLWDQGNPGSAGAVLLFVKQGVRGKTYRLATQAPLTGDARSAFLARIEKAAAVISSHEFSGEPRAFGPPGSPARHRWHAIGQVCGDV